MAADAWENVTKQTLRKSWNKHKLHVQNEEPSAAAMEVEHAHNKQDGGSDEAEADVTDCVHFCAQCPDVREWFSLDSDDAGYQYITDEQIVESVTTEADDDCDFILENIISNGEAFEMLEKCLSSFEAQPEADGVELLMLKNIRDLAAQKRLSRLKQTTMKEFFK